jgi:NAD(P)-dependent dehydrogenase (short-subunit alcohol dehydrogenase family)
MRAQVPAGARRAGRGRAAAAVVAAIEGAGGTAMAIRADVSSEAEVLRMFAQIDERFGRLNALINNAGILATQMRVEQMDAARINSILATNVTGSFLCAREAVRRMSTKHGGSGGAIVNISSRAAVLGSPAEYVDYTASKAAEVARAALWLLSAEASYTTGTFIDVSGGR